jgi:ferric-dicitrate binding protein FerR (iron transport regulator)
MTNREDLLKSDEVIESILRSAPPRPVPSAADVADVRSVVREEWLALCGRRRMRRRLVSLAAAASIVGAIAASLFVLRVPSALPEQVAAIDRSAGPVYLLDEQAILHELHDMPELSTGQTLVTGGGAAAALTWFGGGSLRVDENTRIEFVSPSEIFLRGGRVYFDSQPSALQARAAPRATAAFAVRSLEGLIHHVGTQYMAGISADGLTVSVREGQVKVVGNAADATATAGQQVRLQGSARPTYANIGTHGDAWRWAEKIGPEVIVDQRSAHEFIAWVARESGLDVRFESEAVEQLARTTRMSGGSGGLEPRAALAVLLQTTTLDASIENGSILVMER